MAQDSDAFLDVIGVIVWLVVLMLVLVIVVLSHYLVSLYGNEPSAVINVLPASWDWYLYHI